MPLIISLTTVPPRMGQIGRTLADLLNQKADVSEIRLYVPVKYRRFDFDPRSMPAMPEGIKVCMTAEDFGPATKILPAVRDLAGTGCEILFCDDDQAYDPDWAGRFLAARKQQPDACIVERGYDLGSRIKSYPYDIARTLQPRALLRTPTLAYRLKRAFSLSRKRPNPYLVSGHVDILQGYRGVMVRPAMIPASAFSIPELLWTVDDPWLSGQLTVNKVPIWLNAESPWWMPAYPVAGVEALGKMVYREHDRRKADMACIDYFRANHAIWQDRTAIAATDR